MDMAEKLKEMRHNERLTQKDLADLVGLSYATYRNYETGFRRAINSIELLKILKHPRFQKYIFWFVADDEKLDITQISPMNYGE